MAKKSTAAKAKRDLPDVTTGKADASVATPAKTRTGKGEANSAKVEPARVAETAMVSAPIDDAADTEPAPPTVAKGGAGAARAKPSAKSKKSAASEPAPRKKATVLTTTEIGEHLASTFAIPKTHAKIYLSEAVALIGKNLKKGNKVRIAGLGVFQVKKRPARKGHNPSTGEPMKIKAGKRVGFVASRDLKASL